MNFRFFLGAMVAAIFVFLQTSRGQVCPDPSGTRAVLRATKENEDEVGSVAVKSLRENPSLPVRASVGSRFHKAQFYVLSAGVYAAAMADMHQTLHVRHYSWWWETDPLARPFIHLPAPAYYATGIALATGVNWLSWKLGHSRRWHKLAPLPQLLAIGGNTYGYKSNHYQGY